MGLASEILNKHYNYDPDGNEANSQCSAGLCCQGLIKKTDLCRFAGTGNVSKTQECDGSSCLDCSIYYSKSY